MNRFEAIEKIFKDNGNIEIDGKAVWHSIEKAYGEQGTCNIEDSLIINRKFYKVIYFLDVKDIFYKDGKEIEPCDDFDEVATDINIKEIQVSRNDGGSDEHCFNWRCVENA